MSVFGQRLCLFLSSFQKVFAFIFKSLLPFKTKFQFFPYTTLELEGISDISHPFRYNSLIIHVSRKVRHMRSDLLRVTQLVGSRRVLRAGNNYPFCSFCNSYCLAHHLPHRLDTKKTSQWMNVWMNEEILWHQSWYLFQKRSSDLSLLRMSWSCVFHDQSIHTYIICTINHSINKTLNIYYTLDCKLLICST